MTMNEFIQNCSACGGNWGAMLLTGIKRVFPEHYSEVEEHYNSMDFSGGGIKPFLLSLLLVRRTRCNCRIMRS